MTTTNDTFLETVRRTVARHGMIPPGARVLAAVSGGADSMALLHALRRLGHAVRAATFDHQTRGGESARDAAFAAAAAEALGVPCVSGTAPVAALAAERGESFEQCARAERYAFLRAAAEEAGCAVIATGHHRDDQAETVLMRVLAGVAGRGLGGIPPLRAEGSLLLARPLIAVSRPQIREWLAQNGLDWREDASNALPHTARNRIRLDLMPLLARDHNPAVAEALARLAEAQRADNALLEALLDDHAQRHGLPPLPPGAALDEIADVPLAALRALPPALRRRWWMRLAEALGVRADHAAVGRAEALLEDGATGRAADLGGGVTLSLGRGSLAAGRFSASFPGGDATPLPVPGSAAALGRRFHARLLFPEALGGKSPRDYCTPDRQIFDADRLPGPLTVRARRPGDRFQPLGMEGSRKLHDFLVDRGVPAPLRGRVPLLFAGDALLWVVGLMPAADAAVTGGTGRLLEVEVEHET